MRALTRAASLAALVLGVPQCASAQANPFPQGVWIDCSKPQEAQGLSLVTKEGQYQTTEWDDRKGWATDNAHKKTLLAFVTDPGFKLQDRDTISVIVEHRGDVRLGYTGDAGYQTLEPAPSRGLEEWVTGRWQITDAALARPDGQGVRLEFWSDGGAGAPDISLASVKITHEAVRLAPLRTIVPADGKTKAPFVVDVFDPSGAPVPDGTEVVLACENLPVPASAVTQAGRATFEVTSGSEPRTAGIEARRGDVAGRALLYEVAGEGPLVEFTQGGALEELRKQIRSARREAGSVVVVPPEEGEDPDAVEVHLTFPPTAERARALLDLELPLPGKPETLRFEVGSDGTLFQLNVLLGDADGDVFLYSIYAGDAAHPLNGWYTKEIDVDKLGYMEGPDRDGLLELPLKWAMLSLHYVPGTTEGVLRIRRMEADCVGTMAEAQHATGPVREIKTEPVIIEGVPRVGWLIGHYHRSISALTAALQALGCDATYAELMVESGAAFALAWEPGHYSYATLERAPEDLLVNGALGVGASAERALFATQGEAWEAVCKSIDEGRPVVVARPYYDGRVICGYDPDEHLVHVQGPEPPGDKLQVVPFAQVYSTAVAAPPSDFVLLSYDRAKGRPERDWVRILERAIRFAEWPPEERLAGTKTFGLFAYDDWAATVRAGQGEATAHAAVDLTWPFADRVVEQRRCAAEVLEQDATLHNGLGEAAQHYRAEVAILGNMNRTLAGAGPLTREGMEANFADPAIRENAAQLIEAAKEEEVQAIQALQAALDDLAATQPKPEAPPGTGEELCRTARELKAQGRLTEAAAELAKAIAADPKCVEAYWVLAWVRAELKDVAGAAEAFHKVIELAPNSERAEEARQAVERLGR